MTANTILHYNIEKKLGEGGMGEVFLATDTKLDRKVALKFLPASISRDTEARERLIREAKAASGLNHPGIVTIYAVEQEDDRDFIVMEYIDGQSLGDYLKSKVHSADHLLQLAIQISEGLQEAHTSGIIHRDLKPSNIVVDARHRAHILDFGLAKMEGATKLTKTGSTMGTAAYMSPEQTLGQDVDHRSDLFALGIMLYEMIAGRLPFQGDSEAALAYAIAHEQPEPLARFKVDVSDELQRIVSRLLEKDPSLRYQHADDVTSDLKRCMAPTQSSMATAPVERKNSWRAWMGAGGIAALLVISSYLIMDRLRNGVESGFTTPDETGWANSIAVLPFRDFSPNKDQEYFCDGMTDAIIGRLSGVEDLKVISMTSVMRYKSSDRDLKRIGHDLLVNTVLEGSIQREGDRIRVRAQLINTTDDAHLWSQTYNQELESVFDIQDEISQAIVEAMRIELLGTGEAEILRRYTENIEAYNYYTRGRHLWNRQTEDAVTKAIGHFEKAIELDSNYALAYSGLADAWSTMYKHVGGDGAVDKTEALDNARAAAQTAVALDENLAEAHASLGVVLWDIKDLEGAEAEFLRAIALNPGYAWAHFSYSELLRAMGRYKEGIREENLALELNPMSIPLIVNQVERKEQTFEWQDAEELYKRLIEIEPNRTLSYTEYAWFLAQKMGRVEDAIRQCSLAIQVDKRAYNELAYIYQWSGDLHKALQATDMAIESAPEKHNAYDSRGAIFSRSGMLDSAASSLQSALKIKPDFVSSLWRMGNVFMFKQEYAKADSLYELIASHPDKFVRANGRLFLTQTPLHQGKFGEGLRMLDELRERALDESVLNGQLAYGNLKRAYLNQIILNDQVFATAEYKRVIENMKETDKNSWMVAFSRGGIAYSHALDGDMVRANQLMTELKNDIDDYGPSPVNVYPFFAAQIEMARGNYDSAAVLFERAYQLSPLWVMHLLLAQCYLDGGRIDDAVSVYEDIIHYYDLNRAYWPSLGVVAHYHCGQAYEKAGRHDEAIVQYETFLDIWKNADPGLPQVEDANVRLARLKAEL